MQSATLKEQEAALKQIEEIDSLPEISKQIFRYHMAVESIKKQFSNVFEELDLYEERVRALKSRAEDLFHMEQVKTYPDSGYTGTLTLVKGGRYIPIGDAEKALDKEVFNSLVKYKKGYVRWTAPKENGQDE